MVGDTSFWCGQIVRILSNKGRKKRNKAYLIDAKEVMKGILGTIVIKSILQSDIYAIIYKEESF